MKKAEIAHLRAQGHILCEGKYLVGKAETIQYLDKSTHKPASMDKVNQSMLTEAHGPVFIEQDTRKMDKFDAKTWKPEFKQLAPIVVVCSNVKNDLGVVTLRGVPHLIED